MENPCWGGKADLPGHSVVSVWGALHPGPPQQADGEELTSALLFQPGLTEHLVHAWELQSPGVAIATQPAAPKTSVPTLVNSFHYRDRCPGRVYTDKHMRDFSCQPKEGSQPLGI